MVKAALRGLLGGLAGASLGLVCAVAIGVAVRKGPGGLPEAFGFGLFILIFMLFLAAPGAFVLGLPLASTVRFIRANAPSRRAFLALSALAGMPLGLVNLFIGHAFLDLLLGRGLAFEPHRLMDPFLGPAAVTGGIGLGLGVAKAVWRETRTVLRLRGEWRGTC